MKRFFIIAILPAAILAKDAGWVTLNDQNKQIVARHADDSFVCRAESRDSYIYGKVKQNLAEQQVCDSWGKEYKSFEVFLPWTGAENVIVKKKEEYILEVTLYDEKGLLFSMGVPGKLSLPNGKKLFDERPRSSRVKGVIFTSYRFFHLPSPPSGAARFSAGDVSINLQEIENKSSEVRKFKVSARIYPAPSVDVILKQALPPDSVPSVRIYDPSGNQLR